MRLSLETPPLTIIGRKAFRNCARPESGNYSPFSSGQKPVYKAKEFLNAAKLAAPRSCKYFSAYPFLSRPDAPDMFAKFQVRKKPLQAARSRKRDASGLSLSGLRDVISCHFPASIAMMARP